MWKDISSEKDTTGEISLTLATKNYMDIQTLATQYDDIKRTILSPAEFLQGIHIDIDKDSYLNPALKHLIVLDDVLASSSNDGRITELFTDGSHHRNLSVIAINQNLYFSKDPTHRRNCQYMILFNNPIDQQQIMTLARQMYPGKTSYFMNKFYDAVSKPYGF